MAHLPDSATVKMSDIQKFMDDATPAVQQASRALQSLVDIPTDSFMIGEVPTKLWKLPVPPEAPEEVLYDRWLQMRRPLWTAEQRKIALETATWDAEGNIEIDFDQFGDEEENNGHEDETTDNDETMVADDNEATDDDTIMVHEESEDDDIDDDDDDKGNSDKENIDHHTADDNSSECSTSNYRHATEYTYVPTQADVEYYDEGPDYMYPIRAGESAYDVEDEYEAERPATPQMAGSDDDGDDKESDKEDDFYEYDSENDMAFEGWPNSDDDEPRDQLGLPIDMVENKKWPSVNEACQRVTADSRITLPKTKVPASPPRFYQTPPNTANKPGYCAPPVYWKKGVTGVVCDWLAHPKTKGWTAYLSHVDLGSVGGTTRLQVDARGGNAIKLTRMDIDPASEMVEGRERPLRWLLLEATFREGAVKGRRPYWLLALPIDAISDARMVKVTASGSVMTSCTIGVPGRAPMVHGYGVQRRSFERFMKACALGEAEIVMESNEIVVL